MATIYGKTLSIVPYGLVLNLDSKNKTSYPGSGNIWYDLSGYNNHGLLLNGAFFSNNEGGYIQFDGIDDEVYINNSNSLNFSGTQRYTILCWAYPFGSGTTWHGLVSKGNNQQYALTINSPNLYLHYETNEGGVSALNSSNNSVSLNTWQFFGMRFDGTNKTIWENTSTIATQSATTLSSSSNIESLRIGEGNNGEQFRGRISHVMVYNVSLSDAEILQNFHALRGRYGI